MFGRDRIRLAQSERIIFEQFVLRKMIHFIDDEDDRLFAAAQLFRHIAVGSRQFLPAVHHPEDDLRHVDGGVCLPKDLLPQDICRFQFDAARIHDGELFTAPDSIRIQPVARDAGAVFGNRDLAPRNFIEQGALAHVGPPDDRDQWIRHITLLARRTARLVACSLRQKPHSFPFYYTKLPGICKEKPAKKSGPPQRAAPFLPSNLKTGRARH